MNYSATSNIEIWWDSDMHGVTHYELDVLVHEHIEEYWPQVCYRMKSTRKIAR